LACVATAPSFQKEDFDEVVMTTYGRFSLAVSHGEGCWLWDTEGKKYLDFAAGIATCTLGHADGRLADAVSKQMRTFHHVSNLYYIPQQGELARKLVDSCCADRVFFCNSGAEANEAAIKLARKYAHSNGNESPVIITAINSFHGRTLATMTATGQPKYQQGFGPLVPGFEYVPYNDVDALKDLAKATPNLAAIMLEPLQGEGGIRPATPEFFAAARQICDETGALLVADEVQTGVCRTGKFWGHQNLGVDVDVFTSAKALGGGVPIGAMLCKKHCDVLTPGTHASTYGGNALASAAGLAVMEAIESDELLKNVAARSEQLQAGLRELQASTGVISDVRGWGLILGFELAESSGITAVQLCGALLEAGLLTVPAGPQVLRLVPPLVISESEAAEALRLIGQELTKLVGAA